MDLQLGGKRALVTGASDGIGEGIARLFAREGIVLALHGRNRERLDAVARDIRAEGGTVHTLTGEMGNDDAVDRLAVDARAALGAIDILVANAGGRANKGQTGFAATTPRDFAATFQINVNSTVRLIQSLSPDMKASGFGRIILIASVAASSPRPDLPDYGASKAALINLAVSASKWLAGSGVTVNAISPGAVLTGSMRGFLTAAAKKNDWGTDWETIEQEAVKSFFRIPVGRIGRVEEIAALVALVASPLGGFFHGANLRIDGGQLGTMSP